MRKKTNFDGKDYIYAVFDKVSKQNKSVYCASTDELLIRSYLPVIILDTPLRDLQIFKIGIIDRVTCQIKPIAKKLIKTDCYLFPHFTLSPVGENVSNEEMEQNLIDTKNKLSVENTESEVKDE